jgi:hypothetical protein
MTAVSLDFAARRARQEAVKLAAGQHFGPLVTAALMQEAGKRAARALPVIAARSVVKHADAPAFDAPDAA